MIFRASEMFEPHRKPIQQQPFNKYSSILHTRMPLNTIEHSKAQTSQPPKSISQSLCFRKMVQRIFEKHANLCRSDAKPNYPWNLRTTSKSGLRACASYLAGRGLLSLMGRAGHVFFICLGEQKGESEEVRENTFL